jgi:cellulose synthase/poly-beta-1,6-N-acetylglucosamine synthase-like glycosyltransferase
LSVADPHRGRAPWTLAGLAGAVICALALAGPDGAVLVAGSLIELVFLVYFCRHLAFALSAVRSAAADIGQPLLETGYAPSVSVLVACKNEEAVATDLLESLFALDYEGDRLELVVVDDGSADRTPVILDSFAAREPRLRVVHRPADAGGGKSGALNAAFELARGEIVIVFDADHRPRPDVVRRLVRHFEDPGVSAAQGRCQIMNPDDSLLARLVAIDYHAGYLVNEYGRQSVFRLPAYGGANCAVRASVLRELGGWNPGSVTEDTDLTLRCVLTGRRIRYDVTAVDEEQAVQTLRQFWRQRYRWARGHQQIWRDFRGAVWRSSHLSLAEKIETTLFLLVFHLPVVSGAGFLILGTWVSGAVTPLDPAYAFVLWTLLFLGPLAELGAGLLLAQAGRRNALVLAYFLPVFLVSIALCTKAWVDGLLGRPYSWVKTQRSTRAELRAAAT